MSLFQLQHRLSCMRYLNVLSAISDPKWSKTPNLPSWAPNWASLPRANPLLGLPMSSDGFAATNDSEVQVRFSPKGRFHAMGCILDAFMSLALGLYIVEQTGGSVLARIMGIDDAITVMNYNVAWRLLTWERLANTLTQYPTGGDVKTAYPKTIIASQQLIEEDVPSLETLYNAFHLYYVKPTTNVHIPSIYDATEGIDRSSTLLYPQAVFRASSGR